ncbi:MAG: thiamine phosphate synthase [Nanoarchaeota archaeon]|nr:thiamine phosphate synthase [Nanoarchaeota archaeon]
MEDLETAIMRIQTAGYYFITSSSDNDVSKKPVIETVLSALEGGAKVVQYREKMLPYAQRLPVAIKIKSLQSLYDFLFIINDDPILARDVGADGLHLGQKDLNKTSYAQARAIIGPEKVIGISASTMEQVQMAVSHGADYVSLGPIYKTTTKLDGDPPCGLGLIEKTRRMMEEGKLRRVPISVIGGLNMSNYNDAIKAGADLVCMIHPVLQHNNISSAVDSIRNKVQHTIRRYG